ncbi:autotransporter outer membrane beta-barrel domain-containing protein [Methylovorus mays]|uniref:autotransporter outer membrane beta-barrel domain-containing protein n=1 Tax=Methylovorus mays TaxID=184077 RepID=UPI001E4FF7D0|nr:autotransporter outer membrane beta-barrel domain-containing protein [Methylovorus mays]MCB5205629.1 autotransporter domain-containing protein [Methylovorus mays]
MQRFTLKPWTLLALLAFMTVRSPLSNAACVDNGDGTHTCTGTSTNTDQLIQGQVTVDSSSGAATLENTGTDPSLEVSPGVYGTNITHTTSDVGASAAVTATGGNAVTINNTGANITLDGGSRVYNAAAWTTDSSGLLYNNGVLAGYAAAIRADSLLPELTVTNTYVDNKVFYPLTFDNGIPARITATGSYTASILANNASTTLNNTGVVAGSMVTYGGASMLAPSLLDGTQYATVLEAGKTVLNISSYGALVGDVMVVDRNPLLTQAQTDDSSLVVAYSATDVGPRDSEIHLDQGSIYGSLYLGSGRHEVNMTNSSITGGIYVDQRDSQVIDVSGGVASTLYNVHGDRNFTLNSTTTISGGNLGNVVINDVAGANNTVNFAGYMNYMTTSVSANGLGNNIYNFNCYEANNFTYPDTVVTNPSCGLAGSVSGFSEVNLSGGFTALYTTLNVSGDITIDSRTLLDSTATLTAANVVVGQTGKLEASGITVGINNEIGNIIGNLVNYGTVNIGDATFNVSGNISMMAGSYFVMAIGPNQTGLLIAGGSTTFDSNSIIAPRLTRYSRAVRDGDTFVVANNASGLPQVDNTNGFLQWDVSLSGTDLLLIADVGVPASMRAKVSEAAIRAVDSLFQYKGDAQLPTDLQKQLLSLRDDNAASAAERLRPEIHDGALRTVMSNSDKVFGMLNTRLVDTYLSKNQGMASRETQEILPGKGLWVQGFGDRGIQKSQQGIDGYNVSSAGMAFGLDREWDGDDSLRVGAAAGYARSNITNSGYTVNNRNDINSFMAAAYAAKTWDGMYLNTMLGAGLHTYQTRRQLINHTATGRHDSWQYSARMEAGWPMLWRDDVTLIPMASLAYSHIRESAYEENGKFSRMIVDTSRPDIAEPIPVYVNGMPQYALDSSPINLAVDARSFDSFRGGVGGKAIYSLQQKDWSAEIELRALYQHEFGDLAQDVTSRFLFSNTRFVSPGLKPDRNMYALGATVRLTGDDERDQLTLLTSYDADIRDAYFGQTMSLALRYDFDQGPRYQRRAEFALQRQKLRDPVLSHVQATDQDIAGLHKAMQPVESAAEHLSPQEKARRQAIEATLQTWMVAMANRNLDTYFSTYAADFAVSDGLTRQQWERQRRMELSRDGVMQVRMADLSIEPNGERMLALFTQTRQENGHDEAVQKVVDLEQRGGRWLIVREDSIPLNE